MAFNVLEINRFNSFSGEYSLNFMRNDNKKIFYRNFKKILNTNWTVLLIYFLLTLFFTFPLILNIKDSIPGNVIPYFEKNSINGPDSFYFIWNLWFYKYNFIDLGINPFSHSDLVFYPNGFNNSATGYDNLFNTLLSLPLQIISGNLILTYNILIIFNFIFAAYTTYLLVNYLTGDKKIAILSGLVFGFSSYMLARSLGHLELLTTGAIPLFILFFLKLFKEPKIKNSLFLAIAFLLVSISSWNYALFTLFFIGFAFIFLIIDSKESRQAILNKRYLARFSIFVIFSFLIIFSIAFPFVRTYLNSQTLVPSINEATSFSADLLSYLTPSPLNTLFGQFIDPRLYTSFSSNYTESTTFLGFIEVAFIFIYLMDRKKMKKGGDLWIFLIIIFFILSLGPYLKVAGNIFDKLLLPYYYIFNYFPLFSFVRAPARLSIFIMLFTTIIFALTLKYNLSQKHFSWHYRKIFVILILCLFLCLFLIFAERMIVPYPIKKIKIPFFYNKIAEEKGDYAILDLPINIDEGQRVYNFYQATHQKKIISGLIKYTALVPETYSWIENNEFLRESACSAKMGETINISKNRQDKLDKENLIKEFKGVNIKYIIIHKDLINKYEQYTDSLIREFKEANIKHVRKDLVENYEKYLNLLSKNYNCQKLRDNINDLFGDKQPIFEDELIKVYEI